MFTLLGSKGSCNLHVTVAVPIISFRNFVAVCADDFEILVRCLRCLQVFWGVCLCGALVSTSFLSVSTWCFSFFVWPWLPLYMNSVHSLSMWTCYILILTLESLSCLSCTATFHSDIHERWLQYVSDVQHFLVLDITWLNVIQAS